MLIVLFKSLLKREFIFMKRYFFNFLGSIITFYLFFLFVFLGYSSVYSNSPNYGDTLEGIIISSSLLFLAIALYHNITYTIIKEAKEGTLEQLYMSIFPTAIIFGLNAVAGLLVNFLSAIIMLFLLMITTGVFLDINILSVLPMVIVTMMGILGISYILGGLAIIFKKIKSYLQIMQYVLVGLIVAPVEKLYIFKYLPASFGSHLIRKMIIQNKSIFDISSFNIFFVVFIGLVHLLFGYFIFKICQNIAIKKGLLGHY